MEIEQIAELCAAFEMGKQASVLGLSTSYNEFAEKSDLSYAWYIGHNVGSHKELANFKEGWIN